MAVLSFFDVKKSILLFLPIILIFGAAYTFSYICSETTYCDSFLPQSFSDPLSGIAEIIFKLFVVTVVFLIFKILGAIIKSTYSLSFISKGNREDAKRMRTIFSIIWWILFTLVALNILIQDFGQVFLSLGLVGFGLTFALQQPILNFVGWFMIFIKGVYKEGDRIEIMAGSGERIRGDVIEIGFMTTTLEGLLPNGETKSYKNVSFPNQLVLTSELENYSWDSNYIVNELQVSITYESNLQKAMEIMQKAVTDVIKKNKSYYVKKRSKEKQNINVSLKKLLRELHLQKDEKKREELQKEADKLIEGVEKLEKEEKHEEDLAEEFKPRIRVEMLDSSVQLLARFLTPYTMVKKNRTEINIRVLNMVKTAKDVEIAYPHMQLVMDDKTKKKR